MPSLKITPFMIDIPDADLDELRARLLATRWPAVRANAAWTDGVADEWVRSFTAHWTDAYDWRDEEARLNTFPQYLTTIDGQQIHFVHVRSRVPGALPLIMTHGWPSTFADFSELIGPP
ncbi:MAG: epoxide hydrolase N-terminal domain-containing protein, partial [Acidimicrobiales bacterium]